MPGQLSPQQLQQNNRFQRLGAALELTVSDICGEVGEQLGVQFSPEIVTTLAELTRDKNQRAAQDLEAFAQHAKRSNITAEDVKLLTRRNPQLNSVLVSLQRAQSTKTKAGHSTKTTKTKVKSRDETQGGGAGGSGVTSGQPLID